MVPGSDVVLLRLNLELVLEVRVYLLVLDIGVLVAIVFLFG